METLKDLKMPYTGMKDFVSEYRYFHREEIDRTRSAKILTKFFKYLAKKILQGHMIHLPYRLGNLFIEGREVNYAVEVFPIGWGSSYEYNGRLKKKGEDKDYKYVRMANEGESFRRYSIKWRRGRGARRTRFLDCHKFYMYAKNKMDLFHLIKCEDKEYYIRS